MRLDPRIYWKGENAVLCALLAGAVGALGFVTLGPPMTWVREQRAALEEQRLSYERWQRDFQGYSPVSSAERERWRSHFDHLVRWLPQAVDEAQRIAEVARLFETASTRDLEVRSGAPLDSLGLDLAPEIGLREPSDERSLVTQAASLLVSFKCEYADLVRLLESLESKRVPAYVESLRIRRLFGDVEVRIQAIVFLRGEVTG